jgi:hypothetical protein
VTVQHDNGHDHKYETTDASLAKVLGTGFALLGVMVVGMSFAWGVYEIFRTRTPAADAAAETFVVPDTAAALPPAPNLEADPGASLAALRAREDAVLTTYGWTDSARGIARVPVGRAMELYLERQRLERQLPDRKGQ